MTNEQININIAEHCGWRHEVLEPVDANKIWLLPSDLPDYCNDLNAMRKAELTLWRDECLVEKYEENLKKEFLHKVGYQGAAYWFMANAHTKAVAFIKAIGKWEN